MNIITGAPLWVWIILAYIIFVGVEATKERIVYLPKLFVIPIILIGIKYQTLMEAENLFTYIPTLLIGAFIGFIHASKLHINIIKG